MKKLNEKQLELLEGGKFWGTGSVSYRNTCVSGVEEYYICDQKYFFWFKVGEETNCEKHPC